jgi:hypothetical protein
MCKPIFGIGSATQQPTKNIGMLYYKKATCKNQRVARIADRYLFII